MMRTASELILNISALHIFKPIAAISIAVAALVLLFNKDFSHFLFRSTARAVMSLFFFIQIEGEEYLNKSGKMVLAGNHTGWLDTLVIEAACQRPVRYLAAEWVTKAGLMGVATRLFNVIPISPNKGKEALDKAIKHLEEGNIVGIFPEGRLTPDGKLCRFHKGVAYLHKNSKASIVPFAIQGGFEAWAWNKRIPKLRRIVIQFGQPIYDPESDEKTITRELQDRVQFMKYALERREKAKNEKIYQESVLSIMQLKSDRHGAVKALSLKDKNNWHELSYIELSRQAKNFSNYLINTGIQREDRIAILSESRPEWGIAFFASILVGSITVPLDIKLTHSELNSILSDCMPRILCVSTHYLETAKQLKASIPSIEHILILEDTSDSEYLSIYDIKPSANVEGRERNPEETALIVYTSGTTGNPKGVMITFGNLISQLKDFERVFNVNSHDSLVSILPLNHLLELNVGFLGMLHRGARISYSKSLNPKEIASIMQEKRVTYMITVPLFVKMLKTSVEKEIKKLSSRDKKLFDFMYSLAKYMPNSIRRLMFGRIHKKFGGRLRGFVSGGAPLDREVAEFFDRIGIPIYQGYGLTETSPTISTNYPGYNRIGSVGKPLPSVIVRLSKEGEILAKGPNVMKGYYNKPEMTDEVIDKDGWFHTGDIGEIDKDGYLYITGRIKNMIVLGGGKKIFPEEVEAILAKSEMFKETCVMSVKVQSGSKEGTEEVCVVVVPSDEAKYQDKELEKEIKNEVNRLVQDLAPYKRPTEIAVHLEELPKTATRKIKRKLVEEWYYNSYLQAELV